MNKWLLAIVGAGLLLWGATATWQVVFLRNQLADVKRNIVPLEKEAKATLIDARKKAEAMLKEASDASKKGKVAALRDEQRLNEVFPNLHKCVHGQNDVHERYLDSFDTSGGEVVVTLKNKHSSSPVRPSFAIRFLNEYGLQSSYVSFSWLVDEIKPDETRTDKKYTPFEFGEPVYYQVVFFN